MGISHVIRARTTNVDSSSRCRQIDGQLAVHHNVAKHCNLIAHLSSWRLNPHLAGVPEKKSIPVVLSLCLLNLEAWTFETFRASLLNIPADFLWLITRCKNLVYFSCWKLLKFCQWISWIILLLATLYCRFRPQLNGVEIISKLAGTVQVVEWQKRRAKEQR